jgi:CHAT domain-containing protein/tetratricopeptide (TPR) repeat protein
MFPSRSTKYSLTILAVACALTALTYESRPRPLHVTAFAAPSTAEQGADGVPLPAPGTSIGRELSAGESHSYQITLDAGQYLHAVVEQQGMDAGLTVSGPDGRLLVQLDCRRYGPTPVSLVAETSGLYRLEVRSLERGQKRGRYELAAKEIRPAVAKDGHRIAAEKTFAEGERLLKEWKAESTRQAINKFSDSASNWRAARDVSEAALALKRIGDTYQTLGEFENALAHYKQALALGRKSNGGEYGVDILNEIGHVYFTTGESQKALRFCAQALKLSQAANNRRGEALALNYLGDVYYGFGNLQRSLQLYQKALLLSREIGYARGEALALLNHGYTYSELSEMKEAVSFYNQALGLWQSAGDLRWQAVTLTAIGRLYSRLGESQDALDFFLRARLLIQAIGDPVEEASILSGIAYVHDQLNEKQKSLWYYEQALALFRATRHFKAQANTLYDMGSVYYSSERYDEALSYYQQGLSISKATSDGREQAYALRGVGTVYDSQQDKKRALGCYSKALLFFQAEKDLRGEADTLNLIGRVYEGWGQRRKALDYYQKAVSLSRKAEYPYGEAAALHNLARVERDGGNLAEARARAEEALRVVESLREKVNRQDLRASYFASVRQQYEFYVDLLMRLHRERPSEGFDAAAFEASERARARSMLETLSAARVGDRRAADPALREREASLRKELNERAERRMRLQAGGGRAEAEAAALAKEIDELTSQLREVEAQIRVGSLEHTASLQTQPLGLKAIQERVLGEDTLLLEYALGEERSYLWLVAKDSLRSYELPARGRIEEAANRVRSLLAAPAPAQGEKLAERQARAREAERQYWQEAGALSEMLLAPAAGSLGTKRLLVVTDGALQYVPFNALPVPGRGGEPTPLIVEHEITSQPSASVLATLRGAAGGRRSPAKAVAVFADPVFEADDARLGGARAESAKAARSHEAEPRRASRDVSTTWGGGSIPRLIGSREEAEAIMSIVSGADNLKAVGFDADKATVTGPGLGQFRIIHFATHGILDSEHPELSGLLLSRFDSSGRPKESFLRLDDIYNLTLQADLVVLSACNTGLGKDVKGEGLVGLVRGFMYAGTPRVVASLWKVDDEATAELMARFYREMLQAGRSPAAALREAQVSMWRQRRWRTPYYWAAFVMQGEYGGRIDAGPGHGRAGTWQIGVASLLGALCCLYVWRRKARRRTHEH